MSGSFSKPRLDRMHRVMASYVERGLVPGIVTLLARHDEVDVLGTKAIGGAPMRTRHDLPRRVDG